ncbi:hypothetical protein PTKIN_Ptkin13bG0175800 [Pterospermum kingtungense]
MPTNSSNLFFFFFCILITLSLTDGTQLMPVNNCRESIWPGILGSARHEINSPVGCGEQTVLELPERWSGGGVGCGIAACEADLNVCCPDALVVKKEGKVVGWLPKLIGIAALEGLPIPKAENPPFLLSFFRLIAMLLMILQVLRLAGLLAISLHFALLIHEIGCVSSVGTQPLETKNGKAYKDERLGWGKSLPVPSIQEIVRNDSKSVPERCIHDSKARPLIPDNLSASLQIPLIDFSFLVKGDEDEIKKLDLACKEWGFFSRDGLKRLQGGLEQGIRMNYYPVCSRPDLVLGLTPHSDGNSFTLLLQDDSAPFNFISNSFFSLQIQSNGMYKSIEHRAITNEEKPRLSIAAFMFPDDEQEIGPLEPMIDDQHRPRMYRNIKYVDYIREKFARRMEGKSHLDFVKL